MTHSQDDLKITQKIFELINKAGVYSIADIYYQISHDARFSGISLDDVIDGAETLVNASDLFTLSEDLADLVTHHEYTPLSAKQIFSGMGTGLKRKFVIDCQFVTDSTNTILEKHRLDNLGRFDDKEDSEGNETTQKKAAIAVAEMQTGGRGRRAKRWVSPLAKNLYFSFKYHFPQSVLPHLSSLSMRAGIVLLEALKDLGLQGAKLKWPNDIWIDGKKLAGILVESTVTRSGIDIIIGIGVNNQYDRSLSVIGNHPTCCEAELGKALDRNRLVALLGVKLYRLCEQMEYAPVTLPDLMLLWPAHSYFYGQKVQLHSDNDLIVGEEVGINENGALMIRLESGEVRALFSGDLSLRAYC